MRVENILRGRNWDEKSMREDNDERGIYGGWEGKTMIEGERL